MKLVSRVRHSLSKHGFRGLSAKAVGTITGPVAHRLGHNTLPVGLTEFYRRSELITRSGDRFWQSFTGDAGPDASDAPELNEEYAVLQGILEDRLKTAELTFPLDYGIETESALALYKIIRTLKPEVVVETGVANGHTSYFITSALLKNGTGRLTSVDITDRVGGVLEEDERSVWDLKVLDHSRVRGHFRDIVQSLTAIDVFIHDSDHGYEWQKFELETASRHMSSDGVIACDDADHSYAFLDFCKKIRVKPVSLVDARKVFSAVRLDAR